MTSQTSSNDARRIFPPTRWSLVMAAAHRDNPDSVEALESLCRVYWYPLYAFVRRSGQAPHDAQDLTQEFFCRLLEKHWLESADRTKGKLRTFLIVALKKFMINEWRRASAQRRGGGQAHMALDTDFAENRYSADPATTLPPEKAFDREWALTLLDLTMKRLREEFAAANKADDFETLKSCLMAGHGPIDYAALASRLALNEGATRVAVHRLRKQFRAIYRDELSRTLCDGEDLEAELRHLAAALSAK